MDVCSKNGEGGRGLGTGKGEWRMENGGSGDFFGGIIFFFV
jgi:hypothetical protein